MVLLGALRFTSRDADGIVHIASRAPRRSMPCWNELALGFYRGLGARRMDEWVTHRLIGEDLRSLAREAADHGIGDRR